MLCALACCSPFAYGEINYIWLPKPFYWELGLHQTKSAITSRGTTLDNSPGLPSWVKSLLNAPGFEFGAGFKLAVKLEGTARKSFASFGADLCGELPLGFGDFCMGEFDLAYLVRPRNAPPLISLPPHAHLRAFLESTSVLLESVPFQSACLLTRPPPSLARLSRAPPRSRSGF